MRKLRAFIRENRLLAVLAGAFLLLSPLLLWQVAAWTERAALAEIRAASGHTLKLTVASLRGELSKFEALPRLLARDSGILTFLSAPPGPGAVVAMNRRLEEVNKLYGASDSYLMDAEGLTLAASNWNQERPFVGKNFAFRPYFQDAIAGRTGRYFALGTTSRRRGYYFAHPVGDPEAPLGVAVVKVGILPFEAAWAERPEQVMVTDAAGVVFSASDPGWHYKTLAPLDEATLARIDESQQYAGVPVLPLALSEERVLGPDARLVEIAGRQGAPESVGGGAPRRYLAHSAEMPEAGWTVHILKDTAGLRGRVIGAVAVAAVVLLALALAAGILVQRRAILRERLAVQRRVRAELEQRVDQRTTELLAANLRLETEVAERRSAEDKLRRTQDELIQAGKLAALGKMSAGISHELNQPLSAIRSFSDNAQVLAERGRYDEVRGNLGQISGLTERMARIITHLKTFARKDRGERGPVALRPIIDDALALLETQISGAGVTLRYRPPTEGLQVLGGSVRLQQVLLNVIGNALDAVAGGEQPEIEIDVEAGPERVAIAVRDSGPGIAATALPNVFDPFFTTKEVNQGLGLGLSISYGIVESFGGTIRAANRPEGGAVFTIALPRAEAAEREEPDPWRKLAG